MKVLILCSENDYSNAVINNIVSEGYECCAVFEGDGSGMTLLKRRIKKMGILTVIGQLVFMVTVPKILRIISHNRISKIIEEYSLDMDDDYIDKAKIYRTESVNSNDTITIINDFKPDIIVVNGTRIIAQRILSQITSPIINMHMGITPKYRGVHGAYWAVANDDIENCGVTVHMVNAGIDTGDIISQARIPVTAEDNYATFPYIQLGEGLKIERDVLRAFERDGVLPTYKVDLPSKLWYHPTILEYLKGRKHV